MAGDIVLKQDHGLDLGEARRRLTDFEIKLKQRFGVELSWRGDTATICGKGVSGEVTLNATSLCVNLKLGLMMRPLAGKIREAMQRQLDKALV